MQVAAWIDQLRDQLLATETELRRLVRRHHYDPPPLGTTLSTRAARGGRGITIGEHEARTLLRAAMPAPMAAKHKREAHADMVAALASFASQLLDLSDPFAGPQTVDGALDLADALKAWAARMRWHQATAAAGASWPAPVSVTKIMRQSTGQDVPGLFDAPAAVMPAKPRRKAPPPPAAAQGSLLLPLPGRATSKPAISTIITDDADQAAARRAG
jgi:hypothetical protein